MKQYELTVLFHPDLEIDLDKPLKKVDGIITANGGKITKTDNWGKRKLAYSIAKEDFAVYVFFELDLEPAGIKKINDTLNITDEVLRFLLVAHDPREDKAAIAKEEAAKREAAREAASTTEE